MLDFDFDFDIDIDYMMVVVADVHLDVHTVAVVETDGMVVIVNDTVVDLVVDCID